MRRFCVSGLVLLLTLAAFTAFGFERNVLYEEFSTDWCGHCDDAAPVLDAFITNPAYADRVTCICVHASSTPNDPWYAFDPDVDDARLRYYGITGYPSQMVDGVITFNPNSASAFVESFGIRSAIPSPVEINLDVRVIEDKVVVAGQINSAETALADPSIRLRIALTNKFWDHFHARNGLEEWRYGQLEMYPDSSGVPFSIEANSSYTISAEFDFPPQLQEINIEHDNLMVVAFVQNDDTKEVYQSAWAIPQVEHGVRLTAAQHHMLTDASEPATFNVDLINLGFENDIFDVTVSAENADEWNVFYTTPDNSSQTGASTISLDGSETYMTTISATPSENAKGEELTIVLKAVSQANTEFTAVDTFRVVANDQILIINGDDREDNTHFYTEALSSVENASAVVWKYSLDELCIDQLSDMSEQVILWIEGSHDEMLAETITALDDCLNAGINVLLSGKNAALDISEEDLITTMGASYVGIDMYATDVVGVTGDELGDGLAFGVRSGDGANNAGMPRVMEVAGESGHAFVKYVGDEEKVAGIYCQTDTYRSVLLGVPFETINAADARTLVMQRIADFLLTPNSDVEGGSQVVVPEAFELNQNYPNPFNPETTISFTMPVRGEIELAVYNVMGQKVADAARGNYSAGAHTVVFDGSKLASGVYFYVLNVTGEEESFQQMRKMMLMK